MQAQLNLRSSQPKSLPQYLYSSKKMVLITHGHFWRNFPQPDIFYTACFELFGRGHGHLATLPHSLPLSSP